MPYTDTVTPNDIAGVYVDAGMNMMIESGDCMGFYVLDEARCETFSVMAGKPVVYPYIPGDLLKYDPETGVHLSTGLVVREIARTGLSVKFTSSQTDLVFSNLPFHKSPNGAAIFPMSDGGWVYMTDSERANGNGGSYAVTFDAGGNVKDYQVRLSGTSRNNNGGASPFNSWVSCEVIPNGQCWQVDPLGKRDPEVTILGGADGGYLESVVSTRKVTNICDNFVV